MSRSAGFDVALAVGGLLLQKKDAIMVGRAYQAGLLFVVFGGFLYTGGNQSFVGLLCMLFGLGSGCSDFSTTASRRASRSVVRWVGGE